MWFKFPAGATGISVQQQNFVVEFTDEKTGDNFFRAPDHFAPHILEFKGYSIAVPPPEGAPADLPKADPSRDGAIAALSTQHESDRKEIENLHMDLNAMRAAMSALTAERDTALKELKEAKERIAELEDDGDADLSALS